MTGKIKSFIGHASGQGAVPDHGDDPVFLPAAVPGQGQPQGGRDGSAGMSRAEGVMLAFGKAGKTAQPAMPAQGVKAIPPPGENFMDVALVSHVPDDAVLGAVKGAVQGQGQLHHSQAGSKVATGVGHGLKHKSAYLGGQRLQLSGAEIVQIIGKVQGVQQASFSVPVACFFHRSRSLVRRTRTPVTVSRRVRIFPTESRISVDLLRARDLPQALPPTVTAATRAVVRMLR